MAVKHIDYSKIEFAELAEEQEELRTIDGIRGDDQVTPVDIENMLRMRDQVREFQILMMKYDCALSAVRTKLDVLNKELSLINNRNPFESIKMRIKTPMSIYKKLNSKGLDFTIENIRDNLSDIAGIRVICSFVDDIYMLADAFSRQDDVHVLFVKDYIRQPKENGYRSYHLIAQIPIFLHDQKKYMKVEVQFRTISMDWWASLEHNISYKKSPENHPEMFRELRECADIGASLDERMARLQLMRASMDGRDNAAH